VADVKLVKSLADMGSGPASLDAVDNKNLVEFHDCHRSRGTI
jgi:hypothetical protein